MNSVPVPPLTGLVLLPTPIISDLTAFIFTPAEVNSLSGIFHCCQAVLAPWPPRPDCTTVLDLPELSLTVRYRPSIELPAGCATPISATCQVPVTLPVKAMLENSAPVAIAGVVAAQGQADQDRTGHRDRLGRAQLRPGLAVGGDGAGEAVAVALDLHPVRSRHDRAGVVVVGRSAVGREPVLEAGAVAGAAAAGVMGMKAWVEPGSMLWRIMTPPLAQTLLLHDALDAGDHRAVAGEGLVGKAELVGGVPDVRADGVHQRCCRRPVSAKPGMLPRKYSDRVSAPLVGPVLGRSRRSARPPRQNGAAALLYFSGMDCVPPWMMVFSANGDAIVADLRAAGAVGQAVDPGIVDAVVVVVVALEVVDRGILLGREAPDVARIR